ncbi:MAG TPA: hypothetical protein VEH86_07335 [Candidatus Acidoferrum sp.]|nr:hypothetical protein [Candidatus Acidoferrum sp.]
MKEVGSKMGVYVVPLTLPVSLEPKRGQLEQTLLDAQKRIVEFAGQHGWGDLVIESFFDRARIFDTKADFDSALRDIAQLPVSTVFPKTYSAVLECRVLMAVSPERYAENYPEGIEENSYEKLLAHEIAHRLHVRILEGNEEAMGPIWFFEGFAIYAAEQFKEFTYEPTKTEIQEILRSSERRSYRNYGGVFRFFAKKVAVREMILHAAKEDFQGWLLNLISS